MKRTLSAIVLVLITVLLPAQRLKYTINTGWEFAKGELKSKGNEIVNLPHTWNALDVLDEENGYYRGIGTYRKNIYINPSLKGKRIYLYFDGASQETKVWVNNQKAGEHIGGYARFCFDITNYLQWTEKGEEIKIEVDNTFNEDIPPLTADFTFFGGIYRNLYIVATDEVHLDLLDYASTGVYISTPKVSRSKATIKINSRIANRSNSAQEIVVRNTIFSPDNTITKETTSKIKIKPNTVYETNQQLTVENPQLWYPESPNLYTVETKIYKNGKEIDEVSNPLGFRWYEFDAEKGLFLNNKHYKLIGASRHQDYKNMGNAVPEELAIKDVKLLKEMGANHLRVAHYPHDPVVVETCDKIGLITSVEIPIINYITQSEAFAENCKQMQIEMIKQHYNHPSIFIWAYMNEILLRPPKFENDKKKDDYYKSVTKLAQSLEDITRNEDPYRYTMIPNHGAFDRYNRAKLTQIPMIVGWNLYQGWYGSNINGFADFLDKHHKELSKKPLIVTEYGAGADPRLHSFLPERFDFTIEYETYYHKEYMKAIMNNDFVTGGAVWNFADFSSESRIDAVPNINNKGLVTIDRQPKDAYYYYQALLLETPYLKIGSKQWNNRSGIANKNNVCVQSIEVYSNLERVELFLNGVSLGSKDIQNFEAQWEVAFKNGTNQIEIVGKDEKGKSIKDFAEIDFKLLSQNFRSKELPFDYLNVSVGSKRYFADEYTNQTWLPDQAYAKGSFGYIGGSPFKMQKSKRQSYGSDKQIFGTDNDPIYQTQQEGIEAYKIDVPDGSYDIKLHFAELLSDQEREVLAFNLGEESIKETAEKRVFNIYINEELVLENLNIAQQYGEERAIVEKFITKATKEEGITIKFETLEGKPILNGVQVRRIY